MRARTRESRAVRVGALAAVLLAAGCAADAPQDFLQPAGPIARELDRLWDVVFGVAVGVFVVVEGILLYALIRFRARRRTEEPAQVHGNTKMEIAWTIAPAVLLAALTIPTVGTVFTLAREPVDPLRVTVTGHQWWWEYDYPDLGVVTANELHIPTGRRVLLTLRSDDIIHSYWVPKLAGKQDVVPGRDNHLQIEASEPGWYEGQCAEYCGLSHSFMRLRVRADSPAAFDQWVQAQRRPPVEMTGEAAEGRELFTTLACAGCHVVQGLTEGEVGPGLTHFAMRETFAGSMFESTPENLREWLRDPPGMKPGSGMPRLGLTDDQIDKLVAFLLSLN